MYALAVATEDAWVFTTTSSLKVYHWSFVPAGGPALMFSCFTLQHCAAAVHFMIQTFNSVCAWLWNAEQNAPAARQVAT
jgi:hypothetical protein